jgi:tRNA uridine 5-carboxymethylaminomethyl modification enzyme
MPAPRPRWRPRAHGARTLLLSHSIETIGQMSCNPAIGGIGKGHLVKEIDALGGAMAQAADPRRHPVAHAERHRRARRCGRPAARPIATLYRAAIRHAVENQPNLTVFQQAVDDLVMEGDAGRRRASPRPACASMRRRGADRGHLPRRQDPHRRGPVRRRAARAMPRRPRWPRTLRERPLGIDRLKTGTPPRIDGRSIDYSDGRAAGRRSAPVFSFWAASPTIRARSAAGSPTPASAPTS